MFNLNQTKSLAIVIIVAIVAVVVVVGSNTGVSKTKTKDLRSNPNPKIPPGPPQNKKAQKLQPKIPSKSEKTRLMLNQNQQQMYFLQIHVDTNYTPNRINNTN